MRGRAMREHRTRSAARWILPAPRVHRRRRAGRRARGLLAARSATPSCHRLRTPAVRPAPSRLRKPGARSPDPRSDGNESFKEDIERRPGVVRLPQHLRLLLIHAAGRRRKARQRPSAAPALVWLLRLLQSPVGVEGRLKSRQQRPEVRLRGLPASVSPLDSSRQNASGSPPLPPMPGRTASRSLRGFPWLLLRLQSPVLQARLRRLSMVSTRASAGSAWSAVSRSIW